MTHQFEIFMLQCLQLAEIALQNGNPPVGAIIVLNGEVIGKGIESGKSTGDITNHAEILAIRDTINNGQGDKLSQSTMFTTHEPCIMCSYVLRHHKIPQIVYGSSVEYIGGATSAFNILITEDVPKWGLKPMVTAGICDIQCKQLTSKYNSQIHESTKQHTK